ncbi:MAG: LytTR family DNA-binding domain-containing protein [Bacteroidota bacterium]|nr:LytTR family DNA-binding domain-containing protein [Bacteroidota bacterium]
MNNILKAVIIDDEPSGIIALQLLIDEHISQVKVVTSTTSPIEGISVIENYKPDIVFLDISMPGISGFALLKQLKHKNFNLIFTTAHQEYAIEAIRHDASDYLLKPIDYDDLRNCIDKIIAERNSPKIQDKPAFSNVIGLSVKDGILFIKSADIIRLEASGSYTTFFLDNKVKQVASKGLKEYESQLNPAVFYRCHNSHVVNLKKVVKFITNNGFLAQMTDGSTAEIARKNKDQFLERLKSIGE